MIIALLVTVYDTVKSIVYIKSIWSDRFGLSLSKNRV